LKRPLPDTPEGFNAVFEFSTNQPLDDATAVYVNSIQAMDEWSRSDWNSPVTKDKTSTTAGLDGTYVVYTGLFSRTRKPKWSYVLLGLYRGVLEMTRQHYFYELQVQLWFQGRLIGVVIITKQGPTTQALGGSSVINGTLQTTNTTTSSISNADSGQITDPGYIINWKFNGVRIDSRELFTAILDAMITAASHAARDDCLTIYGISRLGNIRVDIQDLNNPRTRRLTYDVVLIAMSSLTKSVFQTTRRFEETEFDVEWGFTRFAKGSVTRVVSTLGNGTGGVAVGRC